MRPPYLSPRALALLFLLVPLLRLSPPAAGLLAPDDHGLVAGDAGEGVAAAAEGERRLDV